LAATAVKVQPVQVPQWQAIGKDCSGSIDSLVELLQGKLSTAVMQRICTPRTGLFPAPKEISFSCSCPDSASMCKHIAAVLYGVGARLDQKPELLFSLRKVNAKDLVSQAGAGLPTSKRGPSSGKVLDDFNLSDVFGIEMDEPVVPPRKSTSGKQMVPAKKIAAKPQKKVVTTVSSKSIKATAGSKVAKSSAHEGSKRSTTKTVAKKAVAKPQPRVQVEVKRKSARVTPTRTPKTVRPSAKKSSRQP
jgi:uncharacterized Zn finger protein